MEFKKSFEEVVNDKLGNDWEVYTSGGGCWHTMKDFVSIDGKTVLVEIHWSGAAVMYHFPGNPKKLVKRADLEKDRFDENYIDLVYIKEEFPANYDDLNITEEMDIFSDEDRREIISAMVTFTKLYDELAY